MNEEYEPVRNWKMTHADPQTGAVTEHVETHRGSRRSAVARANELTEETGQKVYTEIEED